MRFDATVREFVAALADPHATPPETRGREGGPDARRFAVYRNNVVVGLVSALEGRFPVVRRLVGDDFFRGMAGAYVAAHKPRAAVLIHYGGDFGDFVDAFPPAADLPYLGDVARLENAWVQAYHAAEATALALTDLAAVAPDVLPQARFRLHPATRLLRLKTPAGSIWAAHQGTDDPQPPEVWAGEDVLITRPDADVFVRTLPVGGYALAAALSEGHSLAQAAEAGANDAPDAFDAGVHLVGLLEAGALAELLP